MFRRVSSRSNRSFATKRGVERTPLNLKVGDKSNGFELKRMEEYPEFKATLYKFEHSRLGTRHYHFDTSDTNNVFAFNFTTLPDDHTGKPHILEHLSLCGSKKYPVRDPFFNMLKRSLNTYMNAWTGPDFTSYPFSTVNEKDFYNLLEVYAEATFNPLLRKNDFMQEGWRYELEDNSNLDSRLVYKGVVFNEMKGVYENPKSILQDELPLYLLRGTPYANSSGGNPRNITELTYDDLVTFYKKNYHPSNAQFFSYGDLSPLSHQKYLEDGYLGKYSPGNPVGSDWTPLIAEPIRITKSKPASAKTIQAGKETTFAISYYVGDIDENTEDRIGLSLLNYLLFNTPKSPFYIDFLEEGLASGYCSGVGYETMMKNNTFTFGFENIKDGTSEQIEKAIFNTLERVAEEGLEQGMIDGVLHLIEAQSRIAKNNYGLNIFQSILGSINHNVDDDIFKHLKVGELISEVKRLLAQGGWLEGLIDKYFLKNMKRVHIELIPSLDFIESRNTEEREKLELIEKELTKADKEKIVKEALDLKANQETESDVDILPKLEVSDISKEWLKTPYSVEELNGMKVYFFDQPTNGVHHLRIRFDLKDIDSSLSGYLNMLSGLFTQFGSEENRYDEFAELVSKNMASYDFSVSYSPDPLDAEKINACAILKASFLDSKTKRAFSLIEEILVQPNFAEKDHLINLINIASSSASSNLVDNPLGYAVDYGVSTRNKASQFYNSLANVSYEIT